MFLLAVQGPVHESQEAPQAARRWWRDEGQLPKQEEEACEDGHRLTPAPCAAPEIQVPCSPLESWEADNLNSLEERWQAGFESGVHPPGKTRMR